MAGTIITVGTAAADGYTTRAYKESTGELIWSVNHGSTVYCVCVDSAGNVYCGGTSAIKKYNINGDLQWSINPGGTSYCIAVDNDGYLYSGISYSSSHWVSKFNISNGDEIITGWPISMAGSVRGICTDSDNNVYTAGLLATDIYGYYTSKKFDSSGAQQWKNNFTASLYAINITGSYVSTAGTLNSYSKTGQALDISTGSTISQYSDAATLRAIARNANADRAGDRSASNKTTYIGGATIDHGAGVLCITNNSDSGHVYTGGSVSSSITTRKYTSAGVEVTDDYWPMNHAETVRGIAWTSLEPFYGINAPGLPVSITVGVPVPIRTINPLGLLFPLLLSVPDFSGISQPPDLYAVNYPVKIIYRLYVSGATLFELPISGFQCKRSLGQSTFLTVATPYYSSQLVELLESRKSANNNLIIYSGYIDRNGDETIGEFIKSIIIDIDSEQDPLMGKIKVYGRVIPTAFATQSRLLQNISKRGKTSDGKRTATCAVDFNLRPNDTAIDGGDTWTVGSITLFIDSMGARMEVAEN